MRDSAVDLTTDSYQFWVAHLNLQVTINRIYGLQEKCKNMVICFQSPLVHSLDLAQNCRQIVGISMGTDCAPLIADLFLFCNDRDFSDS